MSAAPVPQAAVDAASRAIAKALLPYEDDDGASPFEWHECDGCPNLPAEPCPCSGQPWVKTEIAEAVAAAVVAAVQGPIKAEALREAARDLESLLCAKDAYLLDLNADRIEGASR